MQERKTELEKCKEHFKSRMEDLTILQELEELEDDGNYPVIREKLKYDYGLLSEYPLSIDFVEEGTFTDQTQPYGRYQISWGGPSEEFRLYADNHVEFWYLNWGTGKHVHLTKLQAELIFLICKVMDYEEFKQVYGEKK